MDPGESPEAALVRELQEELAVVVEVGRRLDPVVWHYEKSSIRLLPYLCAILSGELQALEHERLRWCSPKEFDNLTWAPADMPVLREIEAFDSRETPN